MTMVAADERLSLPQSDGFYLQGCIFFCTFRCYFNCHAAHTLVKEFESERSPTPHALTAISAVWSESALEGNAPVCAVSATTYEFTKPTRRKGTLPPFGTITHRFC